MLPLVAMAPALAFRIPDRWIAHHPATPAFAEDVYLFAGRRWCIGCFTTYPVFLAASAFLALSMPAFAWGAFLVVGVLLAVAQGLSSAGLASTRRVKGAVKTAFGLGLALVVHGVLVAPWSGLTKSCVLGGTLALALLSAVPRALRMRR